MDDAQKRLKKNEYQRKWRANKNPTQPIPSIITKPELVVDTDALPLKYKPKKSKKITLKDTSVSAYTSKLRAFHLRMTGLPLSQDIINAIKGDDYDKKAIQDEFKYLSEKTTFIINNELNAIPNICKIFTKIPGFAKLIKTIVPIKRNLENAQTIRRNNTVINHDDLISFDKQDILKNISKLSNNHDVLLYLLMTILPTRRLDDYRSMTYGVSDANYFDDQYMYIKDTNTKNKKSITILFPPEITPLLPKQGFLLGKYYSAPALSLKFSSIMTKIYSKKITALDLRRMYLTTINNAGASFIERKNIADAVGHSVEESIKYSLLVNHNIHTNHS